MGEAAKRLFVGVPLPASLRDKLAAAAGRLKPAYGGRWVKTANLHITLKFIGEAPATRTAAVGAALLKAAGDSFSLQTTVFGCFPGAGRARVFWLGLAASPQLAALQKAVDTNLAALGWEPDKRRFHPHITLARWRRPPKIDLAAVNESIKIKESFLVDGFNLYESRLSRRGAEYFILKNIKLLT